MFSYPFAIFFAAVTLSALGGKDTASCLGGVCPTDTQDVTSLLQHQAKFASGIQRMQEINLHDHASVLEADLLNTMSASLSPEDQVVEDEKEEKKDKKDKKGDEKDTKKDGKKGDEKHAKTLVQVSEELTLQAKGNGGSGKSHGGSGKGHGGSGGRDTPRETPWYNGSNSDTSGTPCTGTTCMKDCQPTCRYECTNPVCEQVCESECLQPQCQTRCADLTTKSMKEAGCKVTCTQPKCTAICPERGCGNHGCPACETVCGKPQCKLHCPTPACVEVCEEPKCNWRCSAPKKCPKPECTMRCNAPHGCAIFDKTPLCEGMTVVADYAPTSVKAGSLLQQGSLNATNFMPVPVISVVKVPGSTELQLLHSTVDLPYE